MRIFPLALIAFGVFGVLKHYGLIDPAFVHMFWPLLLIAIGIAMLVRGPRWRARMRERGYGHLQDRRAERWERNMNRHFGPGWASLSEEERERFRAGMAQWQSRFQGDGRGPAAGPDGPGTQGNAGAPDVPRESR